MPNPGTLLRPDNQRAAADRSSKPLTAFSTITPVEEVVANTVIAARGAKFFGVPTLFTNAFAERPGLVKDIQAVHSDQALTERTGLNSWRDQHVADWVKATGKRKLVIAGPLSSSTISGHWIWRRASTEVSTSARTRILACRP